MSEQPTKECPTCKGDGQMVSTAVHRLIKCPTCSGTGRIAVATTPDRLKETRAETVFPTLTPDTEAYRPPPAPEPSKGKKIGPLESQIVSALSEGNLLQQIQMRVWKYMGEHPKTREAITMAQDIAYIVRLHDHLVETKEPDEVQTFHSIERFKPTPASTADDTDDMFPGVPEPTLARIKALIITAAKAYALAIVGDDEPDPPLSKPKPTSDETFSWRMARYQNILRAQLRREIEDTNIDTKGKL